MRPASLCLVLSFQLFILSARAQKYYPGGLGNSAFVLWLNANTSSSVTQNGSGQVSLWSDLSGSGYNFAQGSAGNKPVYGATTGPNSRPGLTFVSTSQQFLSNSSMSSSLSFTSGLTSLAVAAFSASQTSQGWERIFDLGSGQAVDNIWFGRKGSTANFAYESWNGSAGDQTYTSNGPIVDGSNNMYEILQQPGTVGNTTAVAFYMGGTAMTNTGAAGAITYVPTSVTRTRNFIARSNWSADNYFSGTMSEILLYRTLMNTTQRVILENYLSAEWGLTAAVSKYSTPSATTYGTKLVGIGYTSASDYFLTDVTGSTDGLGFSSTIGSAGFLNTAGYLMAAHNGQTNSIISPATITGIGTNSGTIGRWNRSWYVQKTGGNSSGSVTLSFNFDDYRGSAPTSGYSYGLLYNPTDGSFANASSMLVTTGGPTIAGNAVSFVVSMSNLASGYYTLIWSTSGTLPVVFDSWEVSRGNGSSLLEWSTSQESGADRFEIQRQTDVADYTKIGTVIAGNTGSSVRTYSYIDASPYAGWNHYRLRILNTDGSSSYSVVKSINFSSGNAARVNIYPNPAVDQLHVATWNIAGETGIVIFNALGQAVYHARPAITAGGVIDIPVGLLPKGMYTISFTSGAAKLTEKFLKN